MKRVYFLKFAALSLWENGCGSGCIYREGWGSGKLNKWWRLEVK